MRKPWRSPQSNEESKAQSDKGPSRMAGDEKKTIAQTVEPLVKLRRFVAHRFFSIHRESAFLRKRVFLLNTAAKY